MAGELYWLDYAGGEISKELLNSFLLSSGLELLLNDYLMRILVSKSCSDQGEQQEKGDWKGSWSVDRQWCEQTKYAHRSISDSWLKEHSNGTWDKHLRLPRTTLFNSVQPQPLDRLIRNGFNCDILQLQIKTVSKSSLQHLFLHLGNFFQIVELVNQT